MCPLKIPNTPLNSFGFFSKVCYTLVRKYLFTQTKSGVLLLTGPPGCGKTATLRVLAKKMNFQIQEWISPEVQYNDKGM